MAAFSFGGNDATEAKTSAPADFGRATASGKHANTWPAPPDRTGSPEESEGDGDGEPTWDELERQIMELVDEFEPERAHLWQQLLDDVYDECDEEEGLIQLHELIAELRSMHGLPPCPVTKPRPSNVGLSKQAQGGNLEVSDLLETIQTVVSQVPAVKSAQVQQRLAQVQPAVKQALQSGNAAHELKRILAVVTDLRDKVLAAVAQRSKSSGGNSKSGASPQLAATPSSPSTLPLAQKPALPPPPAPSLKLDLPDYPQFADSYRQYRAATDAFQAASAASPTPAAPGPQPSDPAADLGAHVADLQKAAADAAHEGEGLQDNLYAIAGGQVKMRV